MVALEIIYPMRHLYLTTINITFFWAIKLCAGQSTSTAARLLISYCLQQTHERKGAGLIKGKEVREMHKEDWNSLTTLSFRGLNYM